MDSMAQLLTSDEDVKIAAAYFAKQPSSLAGDHRASSPGGLGAA